MGSPLCVLGMPLPVHAHPTQVIGKMSIERRALVPFRLRWMKREEAILPRSSCPLLY